jgi:hypothetical protein
MSTLKTNTLSNVAGTASTAIENAINGSAKAWVNFNGTGTVAIRASYNVTSITDNGTGDYTVNFTTAIADTNYVVCVNASVKDASSDGNVGVAAPARNSAATYSTTAVRINTSVVSIANIATLFDCGYAGVSVFR